MTLKIGINGLGRIGRMVVRAIFENNNNKNIQIKHINNRSNSEIRGKLLKHDSIHGKFNSEIKFDKENKCSLGAYEILRTNENVELTIFASGSEVNLAIEVSHKLATENTYSKVISVPCQEIFDKQKENYKSKILDESEHKISIEAGTTDIWKKYIGKNGISFGLNDFGKSAPYKDIYKHFKLTTEDIVKLTREMITNNKN